MPLQRGFDVAIIPRIVCSNTTFMKTLKISLIAVLSLLGGGLWFFLSGSGSAVGSPEVQNQSAANQPVQETITNPPEADRPLDQGTVSSSAAQASPVTKPMV